MVSRSKEFIVLLAEYLNFKWQCVILNFLIKHKFQHVKSTS